MEVGQFVVYDVRLYCLLCGEVWRLFAGGGDRVRCMCGEGREDGGGNGVRERERDRERERERESASDSVRQIVRTRSSG